MIGVNLQLTPPEEVRVHPLDIGLHRGYAVFDYFPVREGRAWFLGDYLRRFRRSARAMDIPLTYTEAQLRAHLRVLAQAAQLDYGGCKLLLTGGPSEDGYTPEKPVLYTYAFAKTPPATTDGLAGPAARVNLLDHARARPSVKSTDYAAALRMQSRQLATGAAELVYHRDGWLSEASRSNLFVVTKEGYLWTAPKESALAGVTRHHVMRVARALGITVLERSLPLTALETAAEVWITSSSRIIQAVGQVEERVIGDGGVGPVARRVAEAFEAYAGERAGW